MLPSDKIRESGQVWEEGPPGNAKLGPVAEQSVDVLDVKRNLIDSQFFEPFACFQWLQPNLLIK